MKQSLHIKPSKPVGFVQMIIGIVVIIIGVAAVIPMTSRNNGPVWFGLLWTGVGIVGAIIGAINAFSDKGIPTEEIEIVSDSKEDRVTRSTEDRLRELDDLRQKKLISEDEYAVTRKKVLNDH